MKKYKQGDRVRIKSLDWYNENKDSSGCIPAAFFDANRSKFCGTIQTIASSGVLSGSGIVIYAIEDAFEFIGGLAIEGLVEEETKPNIIEEAKTYWDSIKDAWICPEGYIFKDENGNVINATKIILEKKKKEYPKSYKGCCDTLYRNSRPDEFYEACLQGHPMQTFARLLICRDAYWKIAGEEMGLGKPWEPDWESETELKYTIVVDANKVCEGQTIQVNTILAFPTEEMRDSFYENFKEEIEICKELL